MIIVLLAAAMYASYSFTEPTIQERYDQATAKKYNYIKDRK